MSPGPRPMPAAEVAVTPGLVRRLLAAQQPDLAGRPVTMLAHGWDNVSCRLGPDLIARLPRRARSAGLIRHEQRWLPLLAPSLPLPVPAPVRVGHPGEGYPWWWSVVPFIPGQAAWAAPPGDRADTSIVLGRFLAALHTPADRDAPANPGRGIPLAQRHPSVLQNLDAAGPADRGAVLDAWAAALGTPPWDGPPVWLHGDLHPGNILVSRGRLSGVIDFGDLTAGDPATDLSVGWMLLPPAGRDKFRAAYEAAGPPGAAGAALWARARGWALVLALVYLAHSADHPGLAAVGQRTLTAVLAS